jgi:hypothetical protein
VTSPKLLVGSEQHDDHGGNRLRRIMRRETGSDLISAIEEHAGPLQAGVHVTWIDASASMPVSHTRTPTIVHVLWTSGGKQADLAAGQDPGSDDCLRHVDVHPGDSIVVPADVPFSLGPGSLAIAVSATPIARGWPDDVNVDIPLRPTHGLQVFDRYNRRTFCGVAGDLVLERWKLTHVQDLRPDLSRLHLLVNLVDPVAAAWPGGSVLLKRARSYELPRGLSSLTLVPDNLGYVLIAYRGDPDRDAGAPLRQAGYPPDAIASIGIPASWP